MLQCNECGTMVEGEHQALEHTKRTLHAVREMIRMLKRKIVVYTRAMEKRLHRVRNGDTCMKRDRALSRDINWGRLIE